MFFSRLLRISGDLKCILEGKIIHGQMITSGFLPDIVTNNRLIVMYVKSERLDYARWVFDRIPERNVVSWTVLICGYSKAGLAENALDYFRLMIETGMPPNHFTYVGAISACASIRATRNGKEIHGRIYRVGQDLNSFVSNSLVNLYAKCGLMKSAQLLFDEIRYPDLVSWTSLLSGYCRCGENEEALRIYLLSRKAGVGGNEFACATVLGACAGMADIKLGKQVHCYVIKCGIRSDHFASTALINLYSKCDELDAAYLSFLELNDPGLATWSTLIGGYALQGEGEKAIDLFCRLHSAGLKPNEHAFSSAIAACANAGAIQEGRQIHSLILRLGAKLVAFVGNSVVDFYAKCGLLEDSSKLFHEMTEHDLVSWNALIAGHVQKGHCGEAIKLLNQMLLEGMRPNIYTYSSILSLCSDLPATSWGKETHCCIIKPGFSSDVVVGSALIDMYAKCGRLNDARKVFDNLVTKNLVSWNTMLVGYAQHGYGKEALEIFNEMQRNRIKPNGITFLGVLSACGHVGLLEVGYCYFVSMTRDHGLIPHIDHYACMVDLFARGGQVRRAYEFIKNMPLAPDKVVWRCLLTGCKNHKDLALGRHAAECILRIDPKDVSAYVMLSTVYADAKMWNETAEVRRAMKEKGLKKEPGCSWIEVKNRLHFFNVSDVAHSYGQIIHEIMNGLTVQMGDAGYVPNAVSHHDAE